MRTVTFGKFANQKNGWQSKPIELKAFIKLLSSHRVRDKKDGLCFVGATIAGENRKKEAVVKVDFLTYDIDGGQGFDEIDAILEKAGLVSILYSTYSHLSTTTKVSTDKFAKWRMSQKYDDTAPTLDRLIEYLTYNGKTVVNPVFDVDAEPDKYLIHGENGLEYVIYHDPVEKYRIVFPLKNPIVVRELSDRSSEAIDAYKAIYHGVGQTLGLKYDASCSTIERLHYLPACPPGKEDQAVRLMYGKDTFLDFNDYPRVYEEKARRSDTPLDPEDYLITDRNGFRFNILDWAYENPDYDIEGMLHDILPESMLRDPRSSGGFHIECPFEERHTASGGNGTYVVNANGEYPWTIYCSHNSCLNLDKRRRTDFLAELIRQGHVCAEDLGIETQPKQKPSEGASALGIDITTLPMVDDELGADIANATQAKADDSLTDDEVLEEAYAEISTADSYSKALLALSRIINRGVEASPELLGYAIGVSALRTKQMTLLLNHIAKKTAWDTSIIRSEAKKKRTEAFELPAKLHDLRDRRVYGIELENELTIIAEQSLQLKDDVKSLYTHIVNVDISHTYDEKVGAMMAELEDRYAKLRLGSSLVFLDMHESRKLMRPVYQYKTAFYDEHSAKVVTMVKETKRGVKKEEINVVSEWLKTSTTIKVYTGITYLPNGPDADERGRFNLWSEEYKYTIKPRQGDPSPMLNHIKEVWCRNDPKKYNWVLLWLADIFQNPQKKPNTALVLTGVDGTGKSFVYEKFLAPVLGESQTIASAKKDNIIGKFNSALQGKLVFLGEETLFAGDRAGMQVLKDVIANPTFNIELKGFESYQVPAFTRFIFTSNLEHSIHITATDRRFAIMEVSPKYANNAEHFQKFEDWCLKEGGNAFFLNYLLELKPEDLGLTWLDLRNVPHTEERREQILSSMEPNHQFFYNWVTTGISDTESADKMRWGLDSELEISSNDIKRHFEQYMAHHSVSKYSRPNFDQSFKKFFGEKSDSWRSRKMIEGLRVRAITMPPRKQILDELYAANRLTTEELEIALSTPEPTGGAEF